MIRVHRNCFLIASLCVASCARGMAPGALISSEGGAQGPHADAGAPDSAPPSSITALDAAAPPLDPAIPAPATPLDAALVDAAALPDTAIALDAAESETGKPPAATPTSEAGTADASFNGDASLAELASGLVDKLKGCAAYESSAAPDAYQVRDSLDACSVRCIAAASCSDIRKTLCSAIGRNDLDRCLDRCEDEPPRGLFRCNDGSLIPHAELCDLDRQCDDGEDELNCGEFRCADGEIVRSRTARCNHVEECDDDSDERACALRCD